MGTMSPPRTGSPMAIASGSGRLGIERGDDVFGGLLADLRSELTAVANYRKGIEAACEAKDFTTRALLEHILGEEEAHVNGIEERTDQIEQMGVENWLSTQVG